MSATQASDPGSANMLQRRISQAAVKRGQTSGRVQVTVGQVVTAQMLPSGAIKGGAGLKFRLGDTFSRDSTDLDTSLQQDMDAFLSDFSQRLAAGWGNFSGKVVAEEGPSPEGVPAEYLMRPFSVKLRYRNKPFMTVKLEAGYDEMGLAEAGEEAHLAKDIADLFAELGLDTPSPVSIVPVALQVAQKIHACSAPGSDRAHDLVDLQLLVPDTDDGEVVEVTRRVFNFRQGHSFPPLVVVGDSWETLYQEAAVGLRVLGTVAEAVAWVNEYISRLAKIIS